MGNGSSNLHNWHGNENKDEENEEEQQNDDDDDDNDDDYNNNHDDHKFTNHSRTQLVASPDHCPFAWQTRFVEPTSLKLGSQK